MDNNNYLYEDLKRHVGHDIVCVEYGDGVNVSIECEDCGEVIIDYDNNNLKEVPDSN